MGSQYEGVDDFPDDFTMPDDGDPPGAAAVNTAFEALGDRTRYLKLRLDTNGAPHPLKVVTDLSVEEAEADGDQRLYVVPIIGNLNATVALYAWVATLDVTGGDFSPDVIASPSTVDGIGAWVRLRAPYEIWYRGFEDNAGLADTTLTDEAQTISKVLTFGGVRVDDVIEAEVTILVKTAADRAIQTRLVYDDGVENTMNGSSLVFDAKTPGGSHTFAGYQIVSFKGAFRATANAATAEVRAEASYDATGSGSPVVTAMFIKAEVCRP